MPTFINHDGFLNNPWALLFIFRMHKKMLPLGFSNCVSGAMSFPKIRVCPGAVTGAESALRFVCFKGKKHVLTSNAVFGETQ